jgi:hypothetical protein
MKKAIIFILIPFILNLNSCNSTIPLSGKITVYNNFSIKDQNTIALLKANEVLTIRVEVFSDEKQPSIIAKDFSVDSAKGSVSVEEGEKLVIVSGLDSDKKVIFQDRKNLKVIKGKDNDISVSLKPIPAITSASANGNFLTVTGRRFSENAKVFLNDKELIVTTRTSGVLIADITGIASGEYKLKIVNDEQSQISQGFRIPDNNSGANNEK